MRKLCISLLMVVAACATGYAQDDMSQDSAEQLAHLAVSPAKDGIGRAVVEVVNQDGKTVSNAGITLESKWGGDEFCESFGPSNSKGAIALPPIHMGDLRLVVKAKGYETVRMVISREDLARPIRVSLKKKSGLFG
ncbi:MAG: hypothetical protein ABIP75_05065 [Pyrinomonadaceae bacterium]